MRFNICIISPEGYHYSQSLVELAELIYFSIRDLSFLAAINVNSIDSGARNIILGGHLIDGRSFDQIPADSIIFNTEIIGSGFSPWTKNIIDLFGRFDSWDYSQKNIAYAKSLGIRSPKLFKVGYHRNLERIARDCFRDIDVLFYGAVSEERKEIVESLRNHGIHVEWLFGVFRWKRDDYIARAKLVINLHQHTTRILEVARIHYLMNNGKAIVSQCELDTHYDVDYKAGLCMSNARMFSSSCLDLLHDDVKRNELEQLSLDCIKKIDAVEIVSEILSL